MMTMTMMTAVASVVSVGMTYADVVAAVSALTSDFTATAPTADDYASVFVGDDYGYSVDVDFGDDDTVTAVHTFTTDDWED